MYGASKAGEAEARDFTEDLLLTITRSNKRDARLIISGHTLAHLVFSLSTRASLDSKESETRKREKISGSRGCW